MIIDDMKLFTIGTRGTTAEEFFSRLVKSGATALIDIRLRNTSQLAGWAKCDDLRYFTNSICRIPYRHELKLAPTSRLLDDSRKPDRSWVSYEQEFRELISQRRIEQLDKSSFDGACLLCAEAAPVHCHRRLVAEFLRDKWDNVEIVHL